MGLAARGQCITRLADAERIGSRPVLCRPRPYLGGGGGRYPCAASRFPLAA